jgi:hypothetical protein
MIAAGFDDYTVMAISGHSSARARALHAPTEEWKLGALESFSAGRLWAARSEGEGRTQDEPSEEGSFLAGLLVDGTRLELVTSALRTLRSPN